MYAMSNAVEVRKNKFGLTNDIANTQRIDACELFFEILIFFQNRPTQVR